MNFLIRIFKGVFLAWAVLCGLALALVVAAVLQKPSIPDKNVLHVRFDGPLLDVAPTSVFSRFSEKTQLSMYDLTRALKNAARDKRISGVLFDIRNPEIGAAQIEEIEEAMRVLRESGKWNLAYIETAGEGDRGDGAYALATCADKIVLAPPGSVNVVGINAEVPFLRGTLDKLKVTPSFQKRYGYKNAPDTFTEKEFSPAHKEAIKTLVDDIQASLVKHVANRRKQSEETVWGWLKTGPAIAEQAHEAGMVDHLAYWDEVEAQINTLVGDKDALIDVGTYVEVLGADVASGPTLALIYGDGPIMRGESQDASFAGDGIIGSDTYAQAFRDAREEHVKGVLFRVNSPGGSYVASDLIRREVELTRAAGIPVVVSMATVAGSGGYFVAINADRIVAQPSTITGSIGVYTGSFATRAFFKDWLGITFDSYKSAPNAAIFSSLDVPDEKALRARNDELDRIYHDFVDKTAKGRGKSYDEIHAVAQGRVWSGAAALKNGLVDELGGLDVALSRLKELAKIEGEVQLLVLPEPPSPLDMIEDFISRGSAAQSRLRPFLKLAEEIVAEPAERELHLPRLPKL